MNCKYYVEDKNKCLSYCCNVNNKDEYEGNCQEKLCPLGILYYKNTQELSELKYKFKKIKKSLSIIIQETIH